MTSRKQPTETWLNEESAPPGTEQPGDSISSPGDYGPSPGLFMSRGKIPTGDLMSEEQKASCRATCFKCSRDMALFLHSGNGTAGLGQWETTHLQRQMKIPVETLQGTYFSAKFNKYIISAPLKFMEHGTIMICDIVL